MTQRPSRRSDPDDLLKYRFAWAAQGARSGSASEEIDASVSVRGGAIFRVSAPLIDFPWEGARCSLREDMCIVGPLTDFPWDDRAIAYFLSEEERETARAADHWIAIQQPSHDIVSASAKINAFLVCLWVVRPTLTHVSMRFEQTPDGLSVSRVLERFQWIKDQLYSDLRDEHLDGVSGLLPKLLAVYERRSRLKNALLLTFRGCISKDWQSAFICFAAAVEGLLVHAGDSGLIQQLADAYGKLVCRYGTESRDVETRFVRLYNVRSLVVHGRAYQRERSSDNLTDLTEFSNLLRQLWRIVLENDEVRESLEQDDEGRAGFFATL